MTVTQLIDSTEVGVTNFGTCLAVEHSLTSSDYVISFDFSGVPADGRYAQHSIKYGTSPVQLSSAAVAPSVLSDAYEIVITPSKDRIIGDGELKIAAGMYLYVWLEAAPMSADFTVEVFVNEL